MIRKTILMRDDKTVIRETTEELQTEKNWNTKHFKLRRTAVGEPMKWRTPSGSDGHRFFSDSEVLPMTERDRAHYEEKQKQARKEARERRKAEKEREKQAEERRFRKKFGVLKAEGNVIVIDTETTGLSSSDEILQLAIVDGYGKTLFNEIFRPEHKTEWPDAEAINKISPTDVADKPPISEYREQIQTIIDSADILVIYNADFDMRMLRRHGIQIQKETVIVDLMILFAEVFGDWNEYYEDYKWQKLSTCADYYHYDWGNDEAHDALSDCKATLYCMDQMREEILPKL